MKKYFLLAVIFWGSFFSSAQALTPIPSASPPAIDLTSDPQYIVMNFSTINELNWAAPEGEWQTTIKPQITAELKALKTALPAGTAQRKLAWSTLMEYMNFPFDEAGPSSPYVIKVRRIFEITREENIPVFIPLNGFQWWDELPELYNWWDADGTATDPKFFERQDNPADFKKRFVAGYDPQNRYNVEWQNWTTPMQLNWRNWGGGGFRLAPPPNIALSSTPNSKGLTYQYLHRARFSAIVNEIYQQAALLSQEGKAELFAGLSIGTEISLNASATPKDEFEPYGYRSVADTFGKTEAEKQLLLNQNVLQESRTKVVERHLVQLSRLATQLGIPKQRIYTHVWSEAKEGEPRYADYAAGAFNLYARPGMSFYGYAQDPFSLPVWQQAHRQFGYTSWGAVEYSTDKTYTVWKKSLHNIFDYTDTGRYPATVMVIYNWGEHKDTPAIQALAETLQAAPKPVPCQLPEVIPSLQPVTTQQLISDPSSVSWEYLTSQELPSSMQVTMKVVKAHTAYLNTEPLISETLDPHATEWQVPTLEPGVYTWFLHVTGCGGTQQRHSQPRVFTISHHSPDTTPAWVRWWLGWENKLASHSNTTLNQ